MNFFEALCFVKFCDVAFGRIPHHEMSEAELEVAIEVLKKLADNRNDWTRQDKETYKVLIDFAKERIKDRLK